MYFPFSELHGWGKRFAAQPQTICSEVPQVIPGILKSHLAVYRRWLVLSLSKNQIFALARERPKAPLCKGICLRRKVETEGLIILLAICL